MMKEYIKRYCFCRKGFTYGSRRFHLLFSQRVGGSISLPFGGGLGWGFLTAFVTSFLVTSCARMGNPDGGWYDEIPPRVVASEPFDRGTNVTNGKISIYFNEYINVENPTEKVVISPPQLEMPDIKTLGKRIRVHLKDSLKANTTYTIDFSDAISDNNEGNPMGNYTFTFSTGDVIDTLEVAGSVLAADNLEPVKGILVGLYKVEEDSSFAEKKTALEPFMRVSRTDSRGRFVIRGVAPGSYTVGALLDMDGNYCFSQSNETMAFTHEVVVPSAFMDTRQDTIWSDPLHIKDIMLSKYIHYVPDNVVLRAFTHEMTERHYIKTERKEANHFTVFFTAPLTNDSIEAFKQRVMLDTIPEGVLSPLPLIRGENFDATDAFVIEPSLKGDTVTYWLRDTALVNQDTLRMELITLQTDTAGVLIMQTEPLEVLSKVPYAKRLKDQQKAEEDWQKKVEKKRKKLQEGEFLTEKDTVMPKPQLVPKYNYDQSMVPDRSVRISFPTPMKRVSTDSIHLYVERDSLWYRAPFTIEPVNATDLMDRISKAGKTVSADSIATPDTLTTVPREWELYTDWIPGAQYSLEIDTLAFEDIYGKTSIPYKGGIVVRSLDEFSSLFVNVTGAPIESEDEADIIVQLLDQSDRPVRSAVVEKGTAEFYYLNAGNYFIRAIIDRNRNGQWDTGNYYLDVQPEEVYYLHEPVECKAKWDITKAWNLTERPLNNQKPGAITKQKAEAAKQIQQRNAQRAAEKGTTVPLKYQRTY